MKPLFGATLVCAAVIAAIGVIGFALGWAA